MRVKYSFLARESIAEQRKERLVNDNMCAAFGAFVMLPIYGTL